MKTITIANHKGGVAKSQTAVEMAYYYASKGKSVLFLDLDAQANSTDLLLGGNQPSKGRLMPEILIEGNGITEEDILTRRFSDWTVIDYVPSSIHAARIESRITSSPKEFIIADALKDVGRRYDMVIIDTPPSAELLSLGALVASTHLLVPVTPDKPSIEGVASILRYVEAIKNNPRLNPQIITLGILVTRYRFAISTVAGVKMLKNAYGNLVLDTNIRECTRVQQAVSQCLPVLAYDPSCNAAKDYIKAFESLNIKTAWE